MAAREENILNIPLSETLEGMHVLCDTGDTGEPYRVAASLFIAEATQAAKDAVSNLDPKDVILKGFTALTAGKPAITANSTLLAAIQSLYAMVGSGKVKIVSDGADQTGMVCWNGTSASGFVINVNEAAIYTRSQWTQSNPDSVTDANWIAAVKTGGTKTPFAAAAQNPNMGGLPTNSSLKFVDNKTTILGMLKMLTAAANVGRLRIVSGNPATGASGKPELAFIVNIVQGTNAETAGTNGLQIFHLTNDYIRVIPSSSVAMAWPTLQTLTDEAIITKLHSTASGDWGGLGVTMGSSGGGMEALWTPSEATYVMVNSDAGNGDPVQINLTRALKATDRVLITWRKQNTSYFGIDVPGQAIINPNAYEHDVFLELVENFVTPSEYYGLFLDQSATEAGSEALSFSAASWGGSTYGPQYLITGIYNISGK